MLRETLAPLLCGGAAVDPFGVRSGVRPSIGITRVTATSTTWTVKAHAGILDLAAAMEAGPYAYAVNADVTGAVTAADATNPRVDIIYLRSDDPAEADGSTVPVVAAGYLAGVPAAVPAAPATPARAMVLATVAVPASGGGAPTVSFTAPFTVAAGAPIPVRTQAERDALVAYDGLTVYRLDLFRFETWVTGPGWAPIAGKMPSRSLVRSVALNVNPTSTDVLVTTGWSADADDGGDGCGITYSGGIFTVPFTGIYNVNVAMLFATTTTVGSRIVNVRKNGVTTPILRGGCQGAVSEEVATVNRRVKLAGGDTLQLAVYQSSGANGTVVVAPETFWQVTYTSAA
jgi:hypothetical protein